MGEVKWKILDIISVWGKRIHFAHSKSDFSAKSLVVCESRE